MSQALAAGTPQLIVAFGFDQFDNARRVEQLGVGVGFDAARFDVARGMPALDRLLASADVTAACAGARARLAAEGSGVPAACDRLERALG